MPRLLRTRPDQNPDLVVGILRTKIWKNLLLKNILDQKIAYVFLGLWIRIWIRLDPHWLWSAGSAIRIRMQVGKKALLVDVPYLRLCILDVLYESLGTNIFQFLIIKKLCIFSSANFTIFGHQMQNMDLDPALDVKCWIHIETDADPDLHWN